MTGRARGSSGGAGPQPLGAPVGTRQLGLTGRRVAALLAALLLLTLGSWVSPARAFACDCAGLSTSRALRAADAVFRGTLLERDDVGRGADARTDLRFSVAVVFKGTVHAEQVVATVRGDQARCGLRPEVGASWVVLAVEGVAGEGDEAVERLVTSLCSGNLPGDSTPVLLGPGRAAAGRAVRPRGGRRRRRPDADPLAGPGRGGCPRGGGARRGRAGAGVATRTLGRPALSWPRVPRPAAADPPHRVSRGGRPSRRGRGRPR